MNILLDTNIIIPLEDTSRILDSSFAELRKLASEQMHCLYVHPSQIDDINRDRNLERRKIVLSRFKQYSIIDNPPILSNEEREALGLKESNDNDRVDNCILFALFRGAVHILVTNDECIHKKASNLGIQDKVFRLEQVLLLLKRYSNEAISHSYSGVKERFLYQIDKNQPFFDSLRQAYDSFDDWYQSCAETRRKCWCIQDDNGKIAAICIYKLEKDVTITDNGNIIKGEILKICTLKVDTAARGKKLGERMLFIVFDYCVKNNIDWTYLHTFGKEQRSLVALCEEYGFSFQGKYKNDDVYIKPMKLASTTLDSLTSLVRFYPFFRDDYAVQRFILPIQPKYHEDLFPDFGNMKGSLFEDDQNLYSCQGNTIKKAYLCHSNTKSVKKGDIILFYRSNDRKSIQCMGIVEDALISDNIEEVFPLVAKRTVYTYSDLVAILTQKTLIILFRFIPIDHEICREKILSVGIKGNIQSIRKISREQYNALIK